MKYALFFVVFLLTENANSQTNKWDGSTDNNWNTAANWSLNLVPTNAHDVVIDINAAIIVNTNATINKLTITSNSTVTFTSSGAGRTITIDNTGSSIDSGSSLELRGSTSFFGTRSMTIAYSGSNQTMSIAGTLNVTATGDGSVYIATNGLTTVTGTLISSGGTITSTAANLTIASGGIYQHARNGGPIPTATWNAASTCLVTGITNTIPSAGLGQSFGNFTWNCSAQTGNLSLIGNLLTVNGNFTVTNTNTGSLRLSNSGVTDILEVGGNYSQTGGTFYMGGTTGSNTWTMNVGGNFSIAGGTFNMNGNSGASTLNVDGNFSANSGTITEVGSATCTINFSGTSTQTFTSGGTLANTINFAINSGATVDFGTSVISNGSNGTFVLNTGGKIITANNAGLTSSGATGTVQSTGSRNYNSGASYEFKGSNTGAFVLTTANTITGTLTINRSAGVTIDQDFTATTLEFTDGVVTTGA
ncbi:MAG TPA: hypothetical protein P5188_11095, partial [Flavobacterium sp.]|nr:hypothetical protein [Flavobacterium sp.]